MFTMSYEFLIILFVLLFCTIVSVRSLSFKREAKKSAIRLHETQTSLAALQKKIIQLEDETCKKDTFEVSLDKAEVTTKLQTSRISTLHGKCTTAPPERYRYIRSLIESGMDSEEIASVLSISKQEAGQLVSLSKLTSQTGCKLGTDIKKT